MLAGIREVAIITTPEDRDQFKRLMGDGSQWGMTFEYVTQPSPDGLAQAYVLTEDWLSRAPSAMVLGDNSSEERRCGKACVLTCRSRRSSAHAKKKTYKY